MFYNTAEEVRAAARKALDEADQSNDFRELPNELRQVLDDVPASLHIGEDEFPSELSGLLWAWEESPHGPEWLAFKTAMALL